MDKNAYGKTISEIAQTGINDKYNKNENNDNFQYNEGIYVDLDEILNLTLDVKDSLNNNVESNNKNMQTPTVSIATIATIAKHNEKDVLKNDPQNKIINIYEETILPDVNNSYRPSNLLSNNIISERKKLLDNFKKNLNISETSLHKKKMQI